MKGWVGGSDAVLWDGEFLMVAKTNFSQNENHQISKQKFAKMFKKIEPMANQNNKKPKKQMWFRGNLGA